jgi:hypothetical protein
LRAKRRFQAEALSRALRPRVVAKRPALIAPCRNVRKLTQYANIGSCPRIRCQQWLTDKLNDPKLTKAEIADIARDYRRMIELQKNLNDNNVKRGDHREYQTEYNDLINKYFEVR